MALELFFKKDNQYKQKYTVKNKTYDRFTAAEMNFLSTFRFGSDSKWFADKTDWGKLYKNWLGKSPTSFYKWLIQNGYLRNPTPHEVIDRVYKTKAQIVDELKNRGLKVSGKRDELIDRLLEADPDITTKYKWQKDLWYPTEKALALLEIYLNDCSQTEENAVMDCLDLLLLKKYSEAAKIAAIYRNGKAIPEGFDDNDIPQKYLESIIWTI